MDRLTMYTTCGYESINPVDLCLDEYSDINFERILDKLGEYEDAEEQGLLLKLPCKIGETVYLIKNDEIIKPRTADMMFLGVLWDEYNKTWFLTKEEAELALKKWREKVIDENKGMDM